MRGWVALSLVAGLTVARAATAQEDLFGPGGPYVPPPAKEGYSYPDCYCTDSDGQRVDVGERACLRIGSRRVLATCGMSQNNPAWRPSAEGCPIS